MLAIGSLFNDDNDEMVDVIQNGVSLCVCGPYCARINAETTFRKKEKVLDKKHKIIHEIIQQRKYETIHNYFCLQPVK